jgi:hypothetical protein
MALQLNSASAEDNRIRVGGTFQVGIGLSGIFLAETVSPAAPRWHQKVSRMLTLTPNESTGFVGVNARIR